MEQGKERNSDYRLGRFVDGSARCVYYERRLVPIYHRSAAAARDYILASHSKTEKIKAFKRFMRFESFLFLQKIF